MLNKNLYLDALNGTLNGKSVEFSQENINAAIKKLDPNALQTDNEYNRKRVAEAVLKAQFSIVKRVAKSLGIEFANSTGTVEQLKELVAANKDNADLLGKAYASLKGERGKEKRKRKERTDIDLVEVYAACYKALENGEIAPAGIKAKDMVAIVNTAERVISGETLMRVATTCRKDSIYYKDRVDIADTGNIVACRIHLDAPAEVATQVKAIYGEVKATTTEEELKEAFTNWCKKYRKELYARKVQLAAQKVYQTKSQIEELEDKLKEENSEEKQKKLKELQEKLKEQQKQLNELQKKLKGQKK